MTKISQISDNLFRFWLPVVLWSFLIFTFSSKPLPMAGPTYWTDFAVKKIAHIIEYGVYSALIFRALINSGVGKMKAVIFSLIFIIVFAVTDEFHQSFIPTRMPRIRDIIFDTIGASASLLYIWKLLPKAPKRLRLLAEKLQIL